MHEYQFRILRYDLTTSLMTEEVHLSNNAAFRAARKLANGRPFEVWRGMDCIFGPARDRVAVAEGPRPAA